MVHFSPKFVVLKYIFFPLKHFKIRKIVEKFRQKCHVTRVANPLSPSLGHESVIFEWPIMIFEYDMI
jgi:hypothetical protein